MSNNMKLIRRINDLANEILKTDNLEHIKEYGKSIQAVSDSLIFFYGDHIEKLKKLAEE